MILYHDSFFSYGSNINGLVVNTSYPIPDNFTDVSSVSNYGGSSVDVTTYVDENYNAIRINQVQGNCGMVYLNGWEFDSDEPRSALKFLKFILKGLKDEGYSQVMYSATSRQTALRELLLEAGFKMLEESAFVNNRTSNTIHMFVCNIREVTI
jgi:hypothetical protein